MKNVPETEYLNGSIAFARSLFFAALVACVTLSSHVRQLSTRLRCGPHQYVPGHDALIPTLQVPVIRPSVQLRSKQYNRRPHLANGFNALASNTTASDNTAVGYSALLFNTTGNVNTAIGCCYAV